MDTGGDCPPPAELRRVTCRVFNKPFFAEKPRSIGGHPTALVARFADQAGAGRSADVAGGVREVFGADVSGEVRRNRERSGADPATAQARGSRLQVVLSVSFFSTVFGNGPAVLRVLSQPRVRQKGLR